VVAPERPSVVRQTAIAFFGNSGGYLIAIVTGIVVARVLGPEGKGVAAYAMLVMSLFTTFGSGLQASIMYECGRNGKPQIEAYGVAVRLLGLTMLPAAAVLFGVAFADPRHASFAYVACAIPFAVYCQIANGILLLHDDVRSTVIQGAIPVFGVALFTIPALTLFNGGLTAVLAIWAVMFAVSAGYAMIRLNAYLPVFSVVGSWDLLRSQGLYGLKAGTSSLANFLNLRIDVFVVSLLLDARTLGIYTLAVATSELLWQLSRPLVGSTMGRIAAADRERAIALTCTVTRIVIAIEVVAGAAVFALVPFAIRFVYGEGYAESSSIIRWLLPGVALYAAQLPLAFFISVKEGKPAVSLCMQVLAACACATISALAIPRLNVYGAALATSLTYFVVLGITALLFARYTGVSVARFTLLQAEDRARLSRLIARMWRPRRLAVEYCGTAAPR
jgi:O-antigen/teichoic acid export membrane protein